MKDRARPSLRSAGAPGVERAPKAGQLHAAAEWLSSAAPFSSQARVQWANSGAAWLRPGPLFTTVTVSATLIHEAVGRPGPQECAPLLAAELDGPVFYRLGEFGPDAGYTVLLPASATRTWRVSGTGVLPPAALLLVPAPDKCEPTADTPWWVVPPDGSGTLCTSAFLASLLARQTTSGAEGNAHA
jgi:hypothetical protein